MKYCFNILHYVMEDVTIECVDSILKLYSKYDFFVTIVNNDFGFDNCSKMIEKYKDNKKVKIITTNQKASFSIANNIGYSYVKKEYNPEYIIVCNNDLLFEDENFLVKVSSLYEEYKYDVLGPNIIDRNGKSTSPLTDGKPTGKGMLAILAKDILRNSVIHKPIAKMMHLCKKEVPVLKVEKNSRTNVDLNGVLHGACLIYSKKYIDSYDYVFYPQKNFYGEEILLKLMMDCDKKIMLYSPELFVKHYESIVSKKVSKNYKRQKKHQARISMLNYVKVYYKEMGTLK